MLDTRCWSEQSGDSVFSGDVQEYSISEIEKHPESSNQNPGSANASKGFRRNYLDEIQYFMQLEGKGISHP